MRINILATAIAVMLVLPACKDSISIQRQYVSDRDRCRGTAEKRFSLYTDSTGTAQNDKEKNAMLLTMFSECMKGVDWKVAGAKKDKDKEKEKPAEAAAAPAPAAAVAPAPVAGSGYYILMPATMVPVQAVPQPVAAPPQPADQKPAAKPRKEKDIGSHFVESNSAPKEPKANYEPKGTFSPAPNPPAPGPDAPSLESIVNRP